MRVPRLMRAAHASAPWREVAVRASDAFVWAELDQSWCDQSWCGGVAALRLSARMVQNVTIRVLMIVVRALPSEPRRALTKGYLSGRTRPSVSVTKRDVMVRVR